jgi:hypothetical protein
MAESVTAFVDAVCVSQMDVEHLIERTSGQHTFCSLCPVRQHHQS